MKTFKEFQEQLSATPKKRTDPKTGKIYTPTPQGTIEHDPKKDQYVQFTNEPGKPSTGLW